jgi:hypothetical protein
VHLQILNYDFIPDHLHGSTPSRSGAHDQVRVDMLGNSTAAMSRGEVKHRPGEGLPDPEQGPDGADVGGQTGVTLLVHLYANLA